MHLRILAVESNPDDLLFLRDVLEDLDCVPGWSAWAQARAVYASSWAEAEPHLLADPPHVVLLNPEVGDCPGTEAFRRIQRLAPQCPVVLLLDNEDPALAEQLLREGAQEYLLKRELDCAPLARAIRNAVNRHRLLTAARSVAMADLLTRLLSRNAFLLLAERDLRLAERLGRRVIIVVAEPEPRYGRASAPDIRLAEAAEELRVLTGSTDLIARIAPDRLAVAILDTEQEPAEDVWARMYTASGERSLRLGAAVFDPNRPAALEDLLERASHDLKPSETTVAS
jgi:DNA-binding NarL/FixJ family response regulator